MRNSIYFLLIFILSLSAFSQNRYQKGYIIDQKNKKITGYVYDTGRKNTPQTIYFKKEKENNSKKYEAGEIRGFGVEGEVYRSYNLKIDRSSDKISNMSTTRRPSLEEEELFIQMLVKGDANLYEYRNGQLKRYFFSIGNDASVTQLIYKKYKTSSGSIKKNNRFQQQILSKLNCETINLPEVSSLRYRKGDLIKIFTYYNSCVEEGYENPIENIDNPFLLRFNPRVGGRLANIDAQNKNLAQQGEFDQQLGLRYGLELEFLLPNTNKKWSVILEPSYQQFDSETTLEGGLSQFVDEDGLELSLDYSSLEIPLGVRYYLFPINDLSFILNGGYVIDIPLNNSAYAQFPEGSDFRLLQNSINVRSSGNIFLGAGAKYKQIGVEFRFGLTNRNLFELNSWDANYNYLEIMLSYDLFEVRI